MSNDGFIDYILGGCNGGAAMTDDHINAAIAEACGWTDIRPCECGFKLRGTRPPGIHCGVHIPDCCNDLNAMHEAEKLLNDTELYGNIVADIVHAKNRDSESPQPWNFARIHATARHRAEAFLRTLGKWATDKESLTVGKEVQP